MKISALGMGIAISLLASPSSASSQENSAGYEIARIHCARCHVLPGLNNFGIGNAPSFKAMVQSKAGDWRDKFEAFYVLRPHPNFINIKGIPKEVDLPSIVAPIDMTFADIEQLMIYVDKIAAELR